MKKRSFCRRLISIILFVVIALSFSFSYCGSGDKVFAACDDLMPSINYEKKYLDVYFRPYAGIPGSQLVWHEEGPYFQKEDGSKAYQYIKNYVLDDKKNEVKGSTKLVNGKKYTYVCEFVSTSSDNNNYKAIDIRGYSINLYDAATDKTVSGKLTDVSDSYNSWTYALKYEYEFVAGENSFKDLGSYTIDLSNGEYIAPDYKTFRSLVVTFSALQSDEIVTSEFSSKCDKHDFDKDGNMDVQLYAQDPQMKIIKTSECSVTGVKEYSLSDIIRKDYLEYTKRLPEYFYSTLKIIYSKLNINKAVISGIQDKDYTGGEIKQNAVLKYDGVTLVEGTDYSVTYKDNVNAGTATVIFTGKGIYTGTVSKTFKINEVKKQDEDGIPEINGTVHGDISSGLWVERPDGTYPVSQWGKVNGKTYYFDKRGYAAANEYADGKWFGADGTLDEAYSMEWKCNSTGWWIEDKSGWYPVSRWLKIDGYWYYFLDSGYMDYSEYRDGCYLGNSGAWIETMSGGHWCSDSKGWWYEDATGWYPTNLSLWIDGVKYSFGSDGYMK